jgi:Zn-dependent M28 family amino/carboxypeptidase
MDPTPEELRGHVETLAGAIGERNVFRPAALRAAEEYIERTWREQGHSVRRQVYEVHGTPCANLEITIGGRGRPAETVLVGAHYDSIRGGPGANDNGSGVAALLAMGRRLSGSEPRRTLRLVAFVNEEPPFFYWGKMGSMVYAREARRRRERIRLMLSLETIGYYSEEPGSQQYPPLFRYFFPDRANFIAFVANFRSWPAMRRTVSAFRHHSTFPAEHVATFGFVLGVSWSDHLAFWRQGYPALMVTDTAFYRYPYYHTAADTPERLNYTALAEVTRGLCGAVADLAG